MKKKVLAVALTVQCVLLLNFFVDFNKWDTDKAKSVIGPMRESETLSDRSVTAFCEAGNQTMWIGTADGLNVYDGQKYVQLACQPDDSATIPDNCVRSLVCDGNGTVWVGTPNGVARHLGWFRFKRYALPYSVNGVYQLVGYGNRGVIANNGTDAYIIKGEAVKPFYHFSQSSTPCNYIFPDRKGGFWAVEPHVIKHFDGYGRMTGPALYSKSNVAYASQMGDTVWLSQSRWLTAVDLKNSRIIFRTKERLPIIATSLYAKDAGHVYLNSSFHGLYLFTVRTGKLAKVSDADLHLRHKDVTISTLYGDKRHNLWVGYNDGGFQILSSATMAFEQFDNTQLRTATAGQNVSLVGVVGQNVIGSTEDEVFCFNAPRNTVRQYLYKDIFSDSPYYRQTLSDVVPLSATRAWLVSNVRVLSCNVADGRIDVVSRVFSPKNIGPLLGKGCRVAGDLVVTSDSPYLLRCRFGATSCDSIAVGDKMYNHKSLLLGLPDGRVLIVMKGLNMAVYNPATNQVEPYVTAKPPGFDSADPEAVCIDGLRRVWIGTRHNGMVRLYLGRHRVECVTDVQFDNIAAIHDDGRGRLWICSHDDMVVYNPTTRNVSFGYSLSAINDSPRTFFYRNICQISGSGALVFGTTRGCLMLPLGVKNSNKPALVLRGIDIYCDDGTHKAINSDLSCPAHITLPHDENRLTFAYGSTSFGNRERKVYQYRLDGYDRDWSAPSTGMSAHYAHLAPGTYTFRVRLVQARHGGKAQECSVKVTVKPSFWLSWATLYFYLVCIAFAVYRFQLVYLHAQRNKLRVKQLASERLRDKRTNEMNMNFFANISHEFRNPLTLIAGPLLMLKSDETLPRQVRKTLNSVCVSVNRMLVLIDQMLDFNKLETDALRLGVAECDAVCELHTLVRVFAETARLRHIEVTVCCPGQNLFVWMDRDKFEKIMSNLLTNALKHTPDGGLIKIEMEKTGAGRLRVSVFNSGSHIDADKIDSIFKRYYQIKGTSPTHQYGLGTGLGLYYVKRLVGLHHGEIKVENVPTGGVAFVFSIPADAPSYSAGEHIARGGGPMQIPTEADTDLADSRVERNRSDVNETVAKPVALIVDDDTAVAQYVRSLFGDEYVVVNKYSAESALESIASIKPDIILSDVIMGEMNGYELCRHLKSDLMTCHIPVVLITAKSNVSEQVEGLGCGANAYVTKPFDPRYLRALVSSILHNVALLRKRLGEGERAETLAGELAEQDRQFLDQLYGLMEQHICSQNLNVATISKELLISQSKFNYKLKELTGETPGNLFRKFKLNKAARMLREGKLNVSEVAYATGFGTVSYFSVAFKKQFGVSPSEYR